MMSGQRDAAQWARKAATERVDQCQRVTSYVGSEAARQTQTGGAGVGAGPGGSFGGVDGGGLWDAGRGLVVATSSSAAPPSKEGVSPIDSPSLLSSLYWSAPMQSSSAASSLRAVRAGKGRELPGASHARILFFMIF